MNDLDVKNSLLDVQTLIDENKQCLSDDKYVAISNALKITYDKITNIDINNLFIIDYLEIKFKKSINRDGSFDIGLNYKKSNNIFNSKFNYDDFIKYSKMKTTYDNNFTFFISNISKNCFRTIEMTSNKKHDTIINSRNMKIVLNYYPIIILNIKQATFEDVQSYYKTLDEIETYINSDGDDDNSDDDSDIGFND